MKELAEQAATGTYTSDQRIIIDSEFQAMASEIQRIAVATDFNGIKLLDGHFDKSITSINQINTNGFGYGASNDISREVVEVNGKLYSGDREGHENVFFARLLFTDDNAITNIDISYVSNFEVEQVLYTQSAVDTHNEQEFVPG